MQASKASARGEGDQQCPSSRRGLLQALALGLTTTALPGIVGVTRATPADQPKRKPRRPVCVAFDVVETLFPLEPLRDRLKKAGLPGEALEPWFSRLIRDAFALDATGVFKSFPDVARATLEGIFAAQGKKIDREAVDHVLAGFGELDAHPDAAPAFKRLRDADVRVFALTNGSAALTQKLLKRNRLDALVERVVSIDEVRRWKPNREVYLHAAKVAKVTPDRLALVAVHSWDVHGSARAGLVTGWVSRLEKQFHSLMGPPDVKGETLDEVARALIGLPAGEGGR
jgi:2-haloacid dehalogenase